MEFASQIIAIFLGVFFAGAFVGYHFRELIGREAKRFAAELRAEMVKARGIEAEIKSKL